MDWGLIITGIFGLLASGGVIYLIVDKRMLSEKEKISNANEVADFYEKVDSIVQKKLEPVLGELHEVRSELAIIKENWCCYRHGCGERLLTEPKKPDPKE